MHASTGSSAPRARKAAVGAFAAAATLALLAPAAFAQQNDFTNNLTNTGPLTNIDGGIIVEQSVPNSTQKNVTASITANGFIKGAGLEVDGPSTFKGGAFFDFGANFQDTSITNVKSISATTGDFTTVNAANGQIGTVTFIDPANGGGVNFNNTNISGVGRLTANRVDANTVNATNVNAANVSAISVNTDNLSVSHGGTVDMGNNVVHGVANPLVGTDAANKQYVDAGLQSAFKEIDKNTQGIAIAMAMSGITLADNKTFALGANVGFFDDKQALAIQGALRISPNMIFNMGIGTGFNDTSTVGGRVGVSASW